MKYRHQRLREARVLADLTQTELALLADVSIQTVSLLERGKGPYIKALRKICTALELDIADILIVSPWSRQQQEQKSA